MSLENIFVHVSGTTLDTILGKFSHQNGGCLGNILFRTGAYLKYTLLKCTLVMYIGVHATQNQIQHFHSIFLLKGMYWGCQPGAFDAKPKMDWLEKEGVFTIPTTSWRYRGDGLLDENKPVQIHRMGRVQI